MAKPLRVLIVEDSEDDTRLLLRELRHGGYDPTFERVDTSEALDEAMAKQRWDVVIADYVMPSFSGLAALQSLKAKGIDLPFVLVSGQIDEGTVVTAMKAGAGGFVSKGNLARLVPAIERELRDAQVRRERKEAEAQLRRVAEKYETILRTALDGFWIADTQGRLLEVNDAYCRMVGYSRDELLTMRIQDVEAFETPEDTARRIQRLMETGFDRFETRHRRKDGTIVDLEVSVNYLTGDSGRLFSFLRDITDRKATEEALRESEERFRLVVANSPDILFLQDSDLRYTWIFGSADPLTSEQVLGKTDFDLLSHEEAQRLTEIKKEVLETGEGVRLEIWLSPGGIRRCYEAVYEPIRREGQITGLASYSRDITERKQAEAEREQMLEEIRDVNHQLLISSARQQQLASEAQRRAAELQAVLDNMVDAVYVCDGEGRVVLSNKAGVLLSGLTSPEEVKGELAELPERYRLRHPDGRPYTPVELPFARALRGETVVQDDEVLFNRRTQRDLFVRVNAAPIRDDKGNTVGAVAVARDVTELIEIERLKDQFIEVAAHELKTPVTGIRGFAQYLIQREHEGLSPQGLKALQAVNRQADRIGGLVNDLLDISRLQAGQLELATERIDLPALVQDVVDRVALTTVKHHTRIVRADPVVVQGDRNRLEQVVSNVLDNAVIYSPKGGEIEVSVRLDGHEAVVSVKDQGIGIPEEKQARIFQRFYRAHTGTPYDYGGMGVGLYISSEIIKRHGGRMWFESEEGKGSTFYFSLPLA